MVHASVDGYFGEFISDRFVVLMQYWGIDSAQGVTVLRWTDVEWNSSLFINLPFDAGSVPGLPVTLAVLPGQELFPPDGYCSIRGDMIWPQGSDGFYGLDGTFTIYEMDYEEMQFRGVFAFQMAAMTFDESTLEWVQFGGSYYESGFSDGVFDYPFVDAGLNSGLIVPQARQRD